jgi:hypothetical protein
MRTRLATFSVLALLALTNACGTDVGEDAASSADGLARVGIEPAPPPVKRPPPPKPPIYDPPVTVLDPGSTVCSPVRFDVRRAVRSCEDLPGAVVENGVTFVPGTGGRFRVERILAGTTVPASIQAKTCSYTWEPQGCADVDKPKLLLAPNETLLQRPAKCLTPGKCGMKATLWSRKFPGRIPNGIGRCPTCGITSNNHLYAVLPEDGVFRYQITDFGGTTTMYWIYTDELPATTVEDAVVVDIELPVPVPDQDVELDPS